MTPLVRRPAGTGNRFKLIGVAATGGLQATLEKLGTDVMELETKTSRRERDVEAFKQDLIDNLYYARGKALQTASRFDLYTALSLTVRDHLIDRWRRTVDAQFAANTRFVYYLSAEYLLGRQLPQNLMYTGTTDVAREALAELGISLESLIKEDVEPGLGNGGLGRLAACYLDSLATLEMPAVGYGLRYEYGIFRQTFQDGWQVEQPDYWLLHGSPWEFRQPDDIVPVKLYGHTVHINENGQYRVRWVPGTTVLGEPYHMLVPGYEAGTVNMLRLWRARAAQEFDFQLFDTGDYSQAVEQKVLTENFTKVLYPNDEAPQGRELRLKQQYFFVACSLADIIRRFRVQNDDWDTFPEKVVIQLNDTHPVLAIPELMRILVDEEGLGWTHAWELTQRVFAYTCHTLLPEALEVWSVSLLEYLLPRHLELIYEINRRFIEEVRATFPGDEELVHRISIIGEGAERTVRMAHLATVASFAVNGVAPLQTRLLQERTLADFARLWPEKFLNETNGVTPRRFMALANPPLAKLITERIGEGWLTDLEMLRALEPGAEEADFRRAWRAVKRENKNALATYLTEKTGVVVDPATLFDVHVKRLHEYKRQLLKVLHVISLYYRIKDDPTVKLVPRTVIFGAKAAPGYAAAKRIIKLIHSVADVVNGDQEVDGRLAVVFPPNFNVSMAQRIYPAADLSEQISLAGKEASGTGNMKMALNGAVTIGTLDGANIDIRERVGEENFFLFGLAAEEAQAHRRAGYHPQDYLREDPMLQRVLQGIGSGEFSNGDTEVFRPIVDALSFRDEYMLLADYATYIAAQEAVETAYRDVERWTRMSIFNTARCGYFSSDRSIREYARDIWDVEPLPVHKHA